MLLPAYLCIVHQIVFIYWIILYTGSWRRLDECWPCSQCLRPGNLDQQRRSRSISGLNRSFQALSPYRWLTAFWNYHYQSWDIDRQPWHATSLTVPSDHLRLSGFGPAMWCYLQDQGLSRKLARDLTMFRTSLGCASPVSGIGYPCFLLLHYCLSPRIAVACCLIRPQLR